MPAYVLNLLLAFIGLLLVVSPGALLTAIQLPEVFGRRPQARPVVRSRWAVA